LKSSFFRSEGNLVFWVTCNLPRLDGIISCILSTQQPLYVSLLLPETVHVFADSPFREHTVHVSLILRCFQNIFSERRRKGMKLSFWSISKAVKRTRMKSIEGGRRDALLSSPGSHVMSWCTLMCIHKTKDYRIEGSFRRSFLSSLSADMTDISRQVKDSKSTFTTLGFFCFSTLFWGREVLFLWWSFLQVMSCLHPQVFLKNDRGCRWSGKTIDVSISDSNF
jgi:hypothetical protein